MGGGGGGKTGRGLRGVDLLRELVGIPVGVPINVQNHVLDTDEEKAVE